MNGEHESRRPEPGIGRGLREAREEKGLTLGQVEEGTKVRARYLRDLERENFGVLPAVYVLGSLKTYADYLGLDGEALSADLKRRLEPEESEGLPGESTKIGSERDTEYGAAPLLTVGFDRLFVGMGIVLICTLAAMTLVFALATNDGPAVSQIREPAILGIPSQIALAGNVLERPERQPRSRMVSPESESREDEGRTTEKKDEDPPEQRPEDASSQDSLFDNVKFVPAPSFSPPATGAASASAIASPLPTTPAASASPAPASLVPASLVPASSASADPAPAGVPASSALASPAPAADVPVEAASTSIPSAATVPAATAPEAASSGAALAPAIAEVAPPNQPGSAAAGTPNGSGGVESFGPGTPRQGGLDRRHPRPGVAGRHVGSLVDGVKRLLDD